MPVWITETGFDINQGSPQKLIAIGSKSAAQTQADWTLRSALTFLREGISSLFFFELNDGNEGSATKYASMGLTDTLFKRKLAMDYLYQTN
jgi:endoglucanase